MKETRSPLKFMIETYSAGGVVMGPAGKIIVVSQHGTSWSLPKGHLNEGESELVGAKREIYEETGIIDLELIKKLGIISRYRLDNKGDEVKTEKKNITIFLFKTKTEILKPVDSDNPEAIWVAKEDVINYLTHKKDKEFFMSVVDEIK